MLRNWLLGVNNPIASARTGAAPGFGVYSGLNRLVLPLSGRLFASIGGDDPRCVHYQSRLRRASP